MSKRTLYQDDPSGASVAILMTRGPAAFARAGTATAKNSAAAAAIDLLQEQFIDPPFEPPRLALCREIGQPVLRGPAARVESERPLEQREKLLPVLRPDRHRL